MIGTVITYEGREFTVAERQGARSYRCDSQAGDSVVLSTRALNKLLGKTTVRSAEDRALPAEKPKPMPEEVAAIELEGILQGLDVTAQMRVVRDLANRYLEERPVIGDIVVTENGVSVDRDMPTATDFAG